MPLSYACIETLRNTSWQDTLMKSKLKQLRRKCRTSPNISKAHCQVHFRWPAFCVSNCSNSSYVREQHVVTLSINYPNIHKQSLKKPKECEGRVDSWFLSENIHRRLYWLWAVLQFIPGARIYPTAMLKGWWGWCNCDLKSSSTWILVHGSPRRPTNVCGITKQWLTSKLYAKIMNYNTVHLCTCRWADLGIEEGCQGKVCKSWKIYWLGISFIWNDFEPHCILSRGQWTTEPNSLIHQ